MLISAKAMAKAETAADLLHRLGDIAPERIRMFPYPGTATVKDVVEIEARENRLFELVDGVLVEKIMGYQEALIATVIIHALYDFVSPRDLGAVTGPDGMIRFPKNLVRMPDVAFVKWEKFPGGEIPDEAAPRIVPDLAVEVLSKGNTKGEMSRKLQEYFQSGVPLVWFVDPKTKTVTVYTSPKRSKVIPTSGTLDGGKVLPGFEVVVSTLFSELKRTPKKSKRKGS